MSDDILEGVCQVGGLLL